MAFDSTQAFTSLLDQIDIVANNFTFKGYQALVNAYARDIGLAITLYIAMLGISMMNRWIEMSVPHATRHILKIILVYAVATQWATFSTFVYEVFTNTPNDIASKLVQALGGSYFGTSDPNAALQIAFNQSIDAGLKTWDLGNWNGPWSPFLFAIAIWIFSLLTAGLVLLELATAKFALAVLLVLAPVFIPLYLWESTRGFFDGWLRWIVGFALVPIFVAAVLLLSLSLQQLTITVIQTAITAKSSSITQVFPFLLSSFVTIGLVWKIPSMAAGIAGGFSSGASQGLASVAGGLAVGAAIGSKAHRDRKGKLGGMVGATQRGISNIRNRFKQQRNKVG